MAPITTFVLNHVDKELGHANKKENLAGERKKNFKSATSP